MAPFFVLDDFVRYLETEKRFSGHTVTAYKKDLAQFVEFTEISKLTELKEIQYQSIRAWIVSLVDLKLENRSINRKLSTLRTFFRWLRKEGHIDGNPMKKVVAPMIQKRLPSFAKESELKDDILKDLPNDDFEEVRDHLMIEFFYQTGIRLSELIELEDKNVTSNSIKVLGKRNKERIIPITPALFQSVEKYRKLRTGLVGLTDEFFTLKNGNKLYPKFVYRKINNYLGKVTNLDKCSPHVLRHTFATHMLNNGAGLEVLKDILGHANLSATQVYTHNSFAKLTNIYSHAHPRGQKNQ